MSLLRGALPIVYLGRVLWPAGSFEGRRGSRSVDVLWRALPTRSRTNGSYEVAARCTGVTLTLAVCREASHLQKEAAPPSAAAHVVAEAARQPSAMRVPVSSGLQAPGQPQPPTSAPSASASAAGGRWGSVCRCAFKGSTWGLLPAHTTAKRVVQVHMRAVCELVWDLTDLHSHV